MKDVLIFLLCFGATVALPLNHILSQEYEKALKTRPDLSYGRYAWETLMVLLKG
jgi:hypothetical protein